MSICFFATDLHGLTDRYEKLLFAIRDERPSAVFLGGDLLPHAHLDNDFLPEFLIPEVHKLRAVMDVECPEIFLILGNDDPRSEEPLIEQAARDGLWHYVHQRRHPYRRGAVFGLAYVPPTPFLLKDWERYDVSRYVPPGSVPPEEGKHTFLVDEYEVKWNTIQKELDRLTLDEPLENAIFLLHSPPYGTRLDHADLDGVTFEHVELDIHIGSIAIQRFIEQRQPLLTLHGHAHESARLSGSWKVHIGRTTCINAAHDGPELALVRFDIANPAAATRQLL